MKSADSTRTEPDFSISDNDLSPIITIEDVDIERAVKSVVFPPLLSISVKDIEAIDAQILRLAAKDLPPILQISAKDLPPVVKIRLEDLIPNRNLNHLTTECYHGTSREAAEKIKKQGFRVGPGAVSGSGIYFSVGGMTIARGYLKGTPCVIRAIVDWGRVAYLDNPEVRKKIGRSISGDAGAQKGMSLGYQSFLLSSKYSKERPTTGIILGKKGADIKQPRIEVIELIKP